MIDRELRWLETATWEQKYDDDMSWPFNWTNLRWCESPNKRSKK